jgi:hypothetical protein
MPAMGASPSNLYANSPRAAARLALASQNTQTAVRNMTDEESRELAVEQLRLEGLVPPSAIPGTTTSLASAAAIPAT